MSLNIYKTLISQLHKYKIFHLNYSSPNSKVIDINVYVNQPESDVNILAEDFL